MCRLYTFFATDAAEVECGLVEAQNALLTQSRRDSSGRANGDGWGIAAYGNEIGAAPTVIRRARAASADLEFARDAERISSRAVVAHVRRATIGTATLANTHPFTLGSWCFAHNGEVTAFDRIGPWMESETPADLMSHRRGETDSELLFLWILGRLRSSGPAVSASLERLGVGLATCLAELAARCREEGGSGPALNLVLTDGQRLLVSRWDYPLAWIWRRQRHRCEICERCQCPRCATRSPRRPCDSSGPYRAVVVASEPLSAEPWDDFPNREVLILDTTFRPRFVST